MGCMDLDSSLLRAFVAVAEQLHFGQAARGLFISQQALSKRIARLESMLGIRLLERDRRSVALTAAGQRLLPEARAAVDAIDAAAAVARTGPAYLTVDVLDEHLSMLPAVRAINESDPGLQLSAVMRHDASDAVTMLRRGQADIALGRPGDVQTPWPRDIQGPAGRADSTPRTRRSRTRPRGKHHHRRPGPVPVVVSHRRSAHRMDRSAQRADFDFRPDL